MASTILHANRKLPCTVISVISPSGFLAGRRGVITGEDFALEIRWAHNRGLIFLEFRVCRLSTEVAK